MKNPEMMALHDDGGNSNDCCSTTKLCAQSPLHTLKKASEDQGRNSLIDMIYCHTDGKINLDELRNKQDEEAKEGKSKSGIDSTSATEGCHQNNLSDSSDGEDYEGMVNGVYNDAVNRTQIQIDFLNSDEDEEMFSSVNDDAVEWKQLQNNFLDSSDDQDGKEMFNGVNDDTVEWKQLQDDFLDSSGEDEDYETAVTGIINSFEFSALPQDSERLSASVNLHGYEHIGSVAVKDVIDNYATTSSPSCIQLGSNSSQLFPVEEYGNPLEYFSSAMLESYKSQQQIHAWDRKMGLKRSHSKTMRLTMKTRNALRRLLKREIREGKQAVGIAETPIVPYNFLQTVTHKPPMLLSTTTQS